MYFVDGENLTIRGQELAKVWSFTLVEGPNYCREVFVWIPGLPAGHAYRIERQIEKTATRSYYYTSASGDEPKLNEIRQRLWALGFDPHVFKRRKEGRSKGVDITLTRDMLSHAFRGNFDLAVLVAGDGDYVPLVDEVKRLGKLVYVMFFGEGVSPQLKLTADRVIDITGKFKDEWTNHPDAPVPAR